MPLILELSKCHARYVQSRSFYAGRYLSRVLLTAAVVVIFFSIKQSIWASSSDEILYMTSFDSINSSNTVSGGKPRDEDVFVLPVGEWHGVLWGCNSLTLLALRPEYKVRSMLWLFCALFACFVISLATMARVNSLRQKYGGPSGMEFSLYARRDHGNTISI